MQHFIAQLGDVVEAASAVLEPFRPSWIDALGPVASIISAVSAVVVAIYALRGIDAWRTEAVAKQRAEVATAALASFYRLKDVFATVRSPIVWAGEMVPEKDEDKEFGSASETAPIRRMRGYKDFLAEFQAQKYLFGAVFGKEHCSLFDGVVRLHNEVMAASQMLFENRGHKELRASFYPVAFETDKSDRISKTLNELISAAELVCAPAIAASAKRN